MAQQRNSFADLVMRSVRGVMTGNDHLPATVEEKTDATQSITVDNIQVILEKTEKITIQRNRGGSKRESSNEKGTTSVADNSERHVAVEKDCTNDENNVRKDLACPSHERNEQNDTESGTNRPNGGKHLTDSKQEYVVNAIDGSRKDLGLANNGVENKSEVKDKNKEESPVTSKRDLGLANNGAENKSEFKDKNKEENPVTSKRDLDLENYGVENKSEFKDKNKEESPATEVTLMKQDVSSAHDEKNGKVSNDSEKDSCLTFLAKLAAICDEKDPNASQSKFPKSIRTLVVIYYCNLPQLL